MVPSTYFGDAEKRLFRIKSSLLDIIEAAREGDVKRIQELIARGKNVDAKNNQGNTALIAAVRD